MTEGSFAKQFLAAFAATIGAFGMGNMLVWSSPALPHLVKEDCEKINACDLPHPFTNEEGSWIGSISTIGALTAAIVVGRIMIPYLGCKWSMITLSVPATAGWICLLITKPLQVTTPTLFYVGRFLTGFAGGAFSLVAPTYVSETAETRYRGTLGNLMQFMVTFGIAFTYSLAINDAVNWEYITAISLAVPIINAVAMLFMPDSPVHLVNKGKDDQAREALVRLRGSECSYIDQELMDIQKTVQDSWSSESSASAKELFTNAVYLKPFGIAFSLMFFQQFCGINGILFYLQTVFQKAGSSMDPGLQSFIVGLAQVIATGFAVVVVDKLGRRILLIGSAFFMCLSIGGLAAFFYVNDDSLGWLPLVCLIVFIVAFSCGFGPLAWTMNIELYPLEARATMSSVTTLTNWLFAFLVSKFVPTLMDVMHEWGVYFLFCGVCAVGVIFCALVVPETRGKTPDDMKRYFQGQKLH